MIDNNNKRNDITEMSNEISLTLYFKIIWLQQMKKGTYIIYLKRCIKRYTIT